MLTTRERGGVGQGHFTLVIDAPDKQAFQDGLRSSSV